MQFYIGIVPFQPRPLGLSLLHAIFPEDTVACLDRRANRLGAEGFRNGYEHYIIRWTARLTGSRRNPFFHLMQVAGNIGHGSLGPPALCPAGGRGCRVDASPKP